MAGGGGGGGCRDSLFLEGACTAPPGGNAARLALLASSEGRGAGRGPGAGGCVCGCVCIGSPLGADDNERCPGGVGEGRVPPGLAPFGEKRPASEGGLSEGEPIPCAFSAFLSFPEAGAAPRFVRRGRAPGAAGAWRSAGGAPRPGAPGWQPQGEGEAGLVLPLLGAQAPA